MQKFNNKENIVLIKSSFDYFAELMSLDISRYSQVAVLINRVENN